MTPVVYTRIPDCDPALIEEAKEYGVADLHEGLGAVVGRAALMSPRMRAIAPDLKMVGQAVTAFNYPGDNLMMHQALHLAGRGQVLVQTSGGCETGALWGDMATHVAQTKGLAGLVVEGGIRDVDALRRMQFPIWSTAISPAHTEKRGPGAVNVPIVVDGALVNPGDVIAADGDGVLVIPLALLSRVLESARARSAKEAQTRPKLAAGASLYELSGFGKRIAEAGIPIRDMTWKDEHWPS
jgi:4-hydroxy-4-methyl-2-oxoglutarate aldolase